MGRDTAALALNRLLKTVFFSSLLSRTGMFGPQIKHVTAGFVLEDLWTSAAYSGVMPMDISMPILKSVKRFIFLGPVFFITTVSAGDNKAPDFEQYPAEQHLEQEPLAGC
ncbi:hypothetical protein [Microbulbifer discodermiae]|uniref:hypothetical protein n=1 Tax=Microbulbifer sp. 2201CG32-9 TaxID=3232309 RepID=UPI00345C3D22